MLRDTRGTRLNITHSASPRRRSGSNSIPKYRKYDDGYSESDDDGSFDGSFDRSFDRSFDQSIVPPDDFARDGSFSDLPESPIKKNSIS